MQSIISFLHQGGFVMWPLLLCLVITIGIGLERAITFRRFTSQHPEDLLEDIRKAYNAHDNGKAALGVCVEANTPFSRIYARGLKNVGRPADSMDLAMAHEATNEIPLLENYLVGLKTIVGIAPLLGLLGTIAGMIISFKEVSMHGLASPTSVMKGVAEALVSTFTGIAIAIIALVLYNYYSGLVKKVVEDIEYYGTELTNFVTGRIV